MKYSLLKNLSKRFALCKVAEGNYILDTCKYQVVSSR